MLIRGVVFIMHVLLFKRGILEGGAVSRAYIRLENLLSLAGAHLAASADSGSLNAIRLMRKVDVVVCANIWHVLIVWPLLIGSKARIAFWVQGLVAEESFMKRNSSSRYFALRVFEWLVFKLTDYFFFVSDHMKAFYEARYAKDYSAVSVVIPCVSDLNVCTHIARRKNRFCYLGGMASWQRFDLVIEVMNKLVASSEGDVQFFVATKEVELCQQILRDNASSELQNVTEIFSLQTAREVEVFLSGAEYGFLIRDDVPVNNVSSPIKLAEYLSCGVTVITTNAIKSYCGVLEEAAIFLSDEFDFSRLRRGSPENALGAYRRCFSMDSVIPKVKDFLQAH